MLPESFPPAALDANRSGRLTPDQSAFYRGEAAGVAVVTNSPAGAAAARSGAPSGAPAVPLDQAILGTWRSDLATITYEFRADGSAGASSARRGAREQRWSLAGPGTIHLDDSTLHASVDGDVLSLGEPPRFLTFRRVG